MEATRTGDEIENNQTVVIFYQLNGTGDFRVLDAFIVGIDPMYSMNEQTSPKITLVSGARLRIMRILW